MMMVPMVLVTAVMMMVMLMAAVTVTEVEMVIVVASAGRLWGQCFLQRELPLWAHRIEFLAGRAAEETVQPDSYAFRPQ